MEDVRIHTEEYDSLDIDVIERLIEVGFKVQPHFCVEVQLANLQALRNDVCIINLYLYLFLNSTYNICFI